MSRSDSTKTRILMAAGSIFARQGFKGATVREICEAAQVNVASVNYYFGDKQGLYLEAVIHARQMRAERVPDPEWAVDTPPETKLRDYVALILNRVVALRSAPWQVRLLVREIIQPTEACKKLVHDYFKPFLAGLMQVIDELSARKLAPEKRLMMAFSIVGQCMYYRFAGDLTAALVEEDSLSEFFELEHLVQHVTEFSLAAIAGTRRLDADCSTSELTKLGREL